MKKRTAKAGPSPLAKSYDLTGPKAQERYNLLYQGFVSGGNKVQGSKGREVIERQASIIRKFEALRDGSPRSAGGPVLKEGGGTLALDWDEDLLLRQYLEQADWRTEVSIPVADLWVWLG